MTDNTVAVIWPMYIALFTSIASIITAVITGFINHKTIKSNNDIIIRKAELDFFICFTRLMIPYRCLHFYFKNNYA